MKARQIIKRNEFSCMETGHVEITGDTILKQGDFIYRKNPNWKYSDIVMGFSGKTVEETNRRYRGEYRFSRPLNN